MKMFETLCDSIEEIEIEKATDSSVWIKGRRRPRISSLRCYFYTFEDARNHLLSELDQKIITMQLELNLLKGKFGNIKGLKP